jgi:hypothetical protein
VATEHWSSAQTATSQSAPNTSRLSLDAYAGELETREIERNPEFHATIVRRLSQVPPDEPVDSDGSLDE